MSRRKRKGAPLRAPIASNTAPSLVPLLTPVKRLPEKFSRDRYQFEQLCRTENTAIYLQHVNGRQKAFEVIVIGIADRKPVKVNERITWMKCDAYECYPSKHLWGSYGFTYTSEQDARAKYDLLNDRAFKISAPPIYPIPRTYRHRAAPRRNQAGVSTQRHAKSEAK
jgi:hypothetical protein